MRVSAGNVWTEVVSASREEEGWLYDYLAAPAVGADHTEGFVSGWWDGYLRVYDRERKVFPTGLLRTLLGAARRAGRELEIEDARTRPPGMFEGGRLGWLRRDQLAAAATAAARTRGIVQMPTGSGKTEVIVAWALAFPHLHWVVMVDTRDLLHQAAERFEKRAREVGVPEQAGMVGDGIWEPRRFTAATPQRLYQGLREGEQRTVDLLEAADGMVVDEVHVLPADSYCAVAQAMPNAYYRFGTSATPLGRADGRDFATIGATGQVVYRVLSSELVEAGILARAEIYFVEVHHPRRTGSFGAVYDELVVNSEERNDVVARMAQAAPRPTLLFVKALDHGFALERRLQGMGMRAEFVKGQDSSKGRRAATTRLQRGDLDVLVTSRIFNKGVDIPLVAGGVNGAAGRSDIDALQRLGRFTRAAAGKTTFTYLDVMDLGNRFLTGHATARARAYEEDGHRVEVISPIELEALLRARKSA